MKHQREVDDAMRFLIVELRDTIATVRECRDLHALQGATDVVKELAKLVIVGASLIDEYMKHRTPSTFLPQLHKNPADLLRDLERTYVAATTSVDGRIKECKEELQRLHQKLTIRLLIDVRQNGKASSLRRNR